MRIPMILALVLLAGGCGSSGDGGGNSAEQDAAAKVAETYVHAVAEGDFAAACAQRTAAEREQLHKLAGSCEKGLTKALGGKEAHTALASEFGELEASKVTIEGDEATVELRMPGADKAAFTLTEVRDGGQWRLTSADG